MDDIVKQILLAYEKNVCRIKITTCYEDRGFFAEPEHECWNKTEKTNISWNEGKTINEAIINFAKKVSGKNAYYYYKDTNGKKAKKEFVFPIVIF